MVYKTACVWDERTQKRAAEKEYGRKLLKYALFSEYGIGELPKISYGLHGKPYFAAQNQPYFNICHTGQQIWLITGKEEVGIDAEEIRQVSEHVARKVLSSEEKRKYDSCLSQEEKNVMFFRFWTLKESFLKALGVGITVPLNSVSFQWDEQGRIVCSQKLSEENWYFSQIRQGSTIVSACMRCEKEVWQGQWIESFFNKRKQPEQH